MQLSQSRREFITLSILALLDLGEFSELIQPSARLLERIAGYLGNRCLTRWAPVGGFCFLRQHCPIQRSE